jgi:ATP-dependent Zn protease
VITAQARRRDRGTRRSSGGTASSSLRSATGGASDFTRRAHDIEVRELADEAFRAAIALIDSHREQLDALATTLNPAPPPRRRP